MNSFVRLVMVLMFAGIGLGVAVLLAADYHTRATDQANYAADEEATAHVLTAASSRQRHAELIVDWQKVAGDGQVLQTALLWRYRPFRTTPDTPRFPLIRFVIPGDRVAVDGDVLKFGTDAVSDAPFLNDTTLCLFSHLYAADRQPAPADVIASQPAIPPDLRSNPARITPYEMQIWHHIWRLREDPAAAKLRGVTVEALPAGNTRVQRGKLYEVWIGSELGVEIVERDAPGTVAEIQRQAQEQFGTTGAATVQSGTN